ncbi:MAG: regulatory protein RecX [Clostridiaceae bacterium]|nr:regulatory protein RecX [Clostridiaceae bacterium]
MTITSAVKQKNNPDMIQIYIDNVYAFSIPEEEYLRLNLYEKQEITDEEVKRIREEVNVNLAKQRALRILAARDRTEYEVKTRLIQSGFDEAAAEGAVMQLKAIGYINDMLFARKYISDRLKLKPKSKRALAYELEKKGIGKDIIAEVLDDFELDETVIAYRLARRKYGKYDVTDPKIQRRIASFLAHKGFSYDIIKGTLEQMIEDKSR